MASNISKISGKRILITGGGGFIGSFLTEALYQENKVSLFDNGRRNAFQFLPKSIQEKVTLINGDIRDLKIVEKITNNQDIILHLAAIAGASFYETDPLLTLSVNLFGTYTLLQVLSKKKIEKIITFSSSEVYGSQAVDVSEEDVTCIGPISQERWSYAVSKVSSDHLARAYFKKHGLPVTIVRPFNVYGPRQVGEGAVSNMVTSAINEKKIYVTGNGLQKRAWCYVSDMISAIELICKKDVAGECFNIGNPDVYITILDLAKKIQSLCKGSKIVFTQGKEVEILERKPNIDKAKRKIGYRPKVGLDQGLKETFEWWVQNLKS